MVLVIIGPGLAGSGAVVKVWLVQAPLQQATEPLNRRTVVSTRLDTTRGPARLPTSIITRGESTLNGGRGSIRSALTVSSPSERKRVRLKSSESALIS